MVSIDFGVFEILMLLCFGSSWPFAIIRSLRSKSAYGKSIMFLMLIFAGYGFGIAHKLIKQPDAIIWLYVLNSSMIFTEIVLYFRYRKRTATVVKSNAQHDTCPPVCLCT